MIGKVKRDSFIHICGSCKSKKELQYSEVKLESKSESATAQVACDCGSQEIFSSNMEDFNVSKFFVKLLLQDLEKINEHI